MQAGEPPQHFDILALPEPAAQPFGFLGPHLAETRPQRLDQLHLVAQVDHALPQFVQLLGMSQRPFIRDALAGAPIAVSQLPGNRREVERIQRPKRDGGKGAVDPGDDRVAQDRRQHRGLLVVAQRLDPAADGRGGCLRQHHAAAEQVVESIERRGAVAGMAERARMRPRNVAPALRVGNERFHQPHQCPPFLHRAAELVHGVLVRALGIEDCGASAGENVTANGAHRGSDRRVRLQGGFPAHFGV